MISLALVELLFPVSCHFSVVFLVFASHVRCSENFCRVGRREESYELIKPVLHSSSRNFSSASHHQSSSSLAINHPIIYYYTPLEFKMKSLRLFTLLSIFLGSTIAAPRPDSHDSAPSEKRENCASPLFVFSPPQTHIINQR